MADAGYCRDCRFWAAYEDSDRRGECTMAENTEDVSLHVLGLRAATRPTGPFVGPLGRTQETSPGCWTSAVLVTDAEFGCVSFEGRSDG